MAETPSAKPTDSFSWPAATNGVSEPPNGLRNAGWAPGDAPPAEEFNWWWQKLGAALDWVRALAVRRFSTLPEAIAATAAGDAFWVDHAFQSKVADEDATLGGIGWVPQAVACDGLRIYVGSGNATGEMKAFTPAPAASPTPLWALTGLAIDPTMMASDGNILAVSHGITGAPTTKSVTIYNASNGTVLFTDTATGYVYAICVGGYRTGTEPRVYWGTHAGGTANVINLWNGTSKNTVMTALRDVKGIACAADLLVAATSPDGTKVGISVWAVDSSGTLNALWDRSQTADPGRPQKVATDGERVYWVVDGAAGVDDYRLFCYGLGGEELWVNNLGDVALVPQVLHVDDRYVYVEWFSTPDTVLAVFDKITGDLVKLHNPNDTVAPLHGPFCLDGSRIWMAVTGETMLVGRGTGRQPTMWRRRSNAYTEIGTPTTLMAQPIGPR